MLGGSKESAQSPGGPAVDASNAPARKMAEVRSRRLFRSQSSFILVPGNLPNSRLNSMAMSPFLMTENRARMGQE